MVVIGALRVKDFSDLMLFLDNSSKSFHLIVLKPGGHSDYELMQCRFFSRL